MFLNLFDGIVPVILTSISVLLGFVYKTCKNRSYIRRVDEKLLRSINAICNVEHVEIKQEREQMIKRAKYSYYTRLYGLLPITVKGYEGIHNYMCQYNLHYSVIKSACICLKGKRLTVKRWLIVLKVIGLSFIVALAAYLGLRMMPNQTMQDWHAVRPYVQYSNSR